MRAELARHTRALARVERTPAAFNEAVARLEVDAPEPLFPSIRVCQLLGFLDDAETRVGCLAHPKATGGVDLRACGVYDVETCEAFLCPSHAVITERMAAIVEGSTDAYLYGLVATDGPFVRAVLEGLAEATGRTVEPADLRDRAFAAALRRLFAVKEALAPGSDGLFGAFRRGGAPGPDAPAASAFETIARTLGGDDRSGNDGDRLEEELRLRFDACAASLRALATARK
jgi:hypothetical protein